MRTWEQATAEELELMVIDGGLPMVDRIEALYRLDCLMECDRARHSYDQESVDAYVQAYC